MGLIEELGKKLTTYVLKKIGNEIVETNQLDKVFTHEDVDNAVRELTDVIWDNLNSNPVTTHLTRGRSIIDDLGSRSMTPIGKSTVYGSWLLTDDVIVAGKSPRSWTTWNHTRAMSLFSKRSTTIFPSAKDVTTQLQQSLIGIGSLVNLSHRKSPGSHIIVSPEV